MKRNGIDWIIDLHILFHILFNLIDNELMEGIEYE